MNYLKKIVSSIGIWLIVTLFLIFLNTLLNYFDVYNYNTYVVISFIIIIIASLISGFYTGIKSSKKGWLEGIKIGLIVVFVSLIINLFTGFIFNIKTIIFYLVILSSNVIGSMFGIQKNKSQNKF